MGLEIRRRLKNGSKRTLSALIGLLLLSCQDAGEQGVTTWDFSLPWSIQEFHSTNAIDFANRVRKETEGRLDIRVRPGAVLGIKGPQSMRALSEGIVDMADMPAYQQVGTEPILGLDSLPFLINDQDDLKILWRHLRPAVDDAFARHGMKIIYIVPWPSQNLFTKVPVKDLDDFRGMKMRTYDKLSSDLMERLDMIPIQMPSQDVVASLASGAIDAVMTSTTTGAAQKYWEFMTTIIRSNHLWVTNITAVNLDSWNALSAEDQRIVERIAADMEPVFWQISAGDDIDKLTVLLENGMERMDPTPAFRDEMRSKAEPMWSEFVERVGPHTGVIISGYQAERERLAKGDSVAGDTHP